MPGNAAAARVLGSVLCPQCIEAVTTVRSPVCPCCGLPIAGSQEGDHLCGDCITVKRHFRKARACAIYSGALLKLVHAYKYRGRISLAKPLGTLLYLDFIRHFDPCAIDRIIPVPLHARRLRSRGYNQVLLMLRHWPALSQQAEPQAGRIRIDGKILVRKENTRPQTGLDRRARKENIRGAFAVTGPKGIAGKSLLLVDDVYTTGSTAEECARTLMKAGAAGVSVLTLARAV